MLERVRRFFDVRPGEGWAVVVTAVYVGLAVASFLLAKPIRNGLFLGEYGAYKLVYVYIGVPIALSLFVPAYNFFAARVGMRTVITASLLFLSSNVVLFWFGVRFSRAPWLSAAFYIWVNCYSVIAPVQAWSFANRVFNTRQARRLFGLVGAGASSGAILGGLLARVLVGPLGTTNLLLVLAAMIALTAVVVNLGWNVARKESSTRRASAQVAFGQTLRLIRDTPYYRNIAMLVLLVAIATQWATFQYSILVEKAYAGNQDRLTAFFGEFNFYLGIAALIFQLFVTGPALRRFGIGVTVMLLPVSLAFATTLVVGWPVLWTVLLTSAFDGGFRFSVDKATFELLYLPIPSGLKSQIKSTIDVIVSRCADALGGILLGLATQGLALPYLSLPGLGLGVRGLAVINLGFIGAWMLVAIALKRGYVNAIQESIHAHRIDAERASTTTLDRDTSDFLAGKLVATDTQEILYALDLFATQYERTPHPALRSLLHHPDAMIRRRVIELLDEAADVDAAPLVEELLEDPDLATRTDALLFLAHHSRIDPLERIRELGEFPDFSVQAGLIAYYAHPGDTQNLDAARLLLEAMIADTGPGARRTHLEAARLLAILPPEFAEQAEQLLDDPHPEVVRHALSAVAQSGTRNVAPRLVASLGDPKLAPAAASALAARGDDIVPVLNAALDSAAVTIAAKREIPSILERIDTATAQDALTGHLLQPDDVLRLRVVASLNKLRERHPERVIDRDAVEMGLAAEIYGTYTRYLHLDALTREFGKDQVATAALSASIPQAHERIFRLMGLLWPQHDLESVYVALQAGSGGLSANAVELMEYLLKPHLRELVIPLIDPTKTAAERVAIARQKVGRDAVSRDEVVDAMLASEDPWLLASGVYAVGQLRMVQFRDRLELLVTNGDLIVAEAARAALHKLDARPAGRAAEPPADAQGESLLLSHDAMGIG